PEGDRGDCPTGRARTSYILCLFSPCCFRALGSRRFSAGLGRQIWVTASRRSWTSMRTCSSRRCVWGQEAPRVGGLAREVAPGVQEVPRCRGGTGARRPHRLRRPGLADLCVLPDAPADGVGALPEVWRLDGARAPTLRCVVGRCYSDWAESRGSPGALSPDG